MTRGSAVLTQWCRVAFLAAFGVLAFHTALPLAWKFGYRGGDVPFSGPTPFVLLFLAVTLLLFLASEPIRIRKRHWRHLGVYPPLWFAVVLALLIGVAVDRYLPAWYADRPNWNDRGTLALVATTLVFAIVVRQFPFQKYKPIPTLTPATEITWDSIQQWLTSGERAVEPDELDFFRHRDMARRVTAAVREGRSVSVIGPYGSGKTGVLNSVRADLLSINPPLFVVAELNAWAIGRAKDAPRLALERVLSALDDYADMQKFRAIPSAYRRLADAEPTGRLAKLLGPSAEGDPVDQIERLTPLLIALDARVVLFVEDVERAELAGMDTRHLLRFLWALRRSERMSFVVAYASKANGPL